MSKQLYAILLSALFLMTSACEKEKTETTENTAKEETVNTTDSSSSATGTKIGAEYQGGIIFYIFKSGDPGYVSGEVHGLIVYAQELSNNRQWGCSSYEFGNLSTAIGGGKSNTTLVANTCQAVDIATKICENFEHAGYTDWYLPSRDELYAVYDNLKPLGLGNFSNIKYWSSSESNTYNTVEVMVLSSGYKTIQSKNNTARVRPIRAF